MGKTKKSESAWAMAMRLTDRIHELERAVELLVHADYCREMKRRTFLLTDDYKKWVRECEEAVLEARKIKCVAELVKRCKRQALREFRELRKKAAVKP